MKYYDTYMDTVAHPLDWWAYGGYPAVVRELRCIKAHARHRVHQKIVEHYRRTGHPLWHPVGNRGFAELRHAIMQSRVLNNVLV
jgi:hypothetical protein